MHPMKRQVVGALLLASVAFGAVEERVDWASFLERQDPIWETLPAQFHDGAFLGNGLMGATIYRDGDRRMRWEMGRADVTEHRRDNSRLPIGGLVLETVGKIVDGTLRLDLWNAEARGEVVTDQGTVQFRSLIHADTMIMLIELDATGEETAAVFTWQPASGQLTPSLAKFNDPPNPPGTNTVTDGEQVFTQRRYAGGEFATAWKEAAADRGRRVYLSIADSFPRNTAHQEAADTVRKAAAEDPDALRASHQTWWHALYPRSFVSVPDPKVESFYWIQIYKLASASRPDRGPVDLAGPWFLDCSWGRIWWNLNIQTLYLPAYAANQLELGESLVRLFDDHRTNFFRQGQELWNCDDCASVSHTSDKQGRRGDGMLSPAHFLNPGDFTWALHNYYQHYRYSMDASIVTNQQRHAFYPLLRGSVNAYLHLLRTGDDGKLHLPVLHSPEYGNDADNNYNLALLRWGCQTLIDLNRRYQLDDPLLPKWRETLENLVAYPVDQNGLRIGAGMSFTQSHRHWSHILMVHPLHILDLEDPANRELVAKSIRHWLTVDGSRGVYGWSRAAAASLYAALGDGNNALDQVRRHMADKRFVRPNTMYIEGMPVIECSIVLARSVQDLLIQSHGDLIRVFPAVPDGWRDAVFHNLLAEGAFLVSAARRDGRTLWVRVKSLAGEPCRIRPGLDGDVKATVPMKSLGGGRYELALARGEEALLFVGDQPPAAVAAPLPAAPALSNPFGIKVSKKEWPPSLSRGKPARASSVWGEGLEAEKACDGDEDSRWGAAPGSRSGWLEVDLGEPLEIGRAVVMEIGYPRTREFVIEYQDGVAWKELHRGTTIGESSTYAFPPVRARRVRLNILKADEVPTIEEFRVLPPASGKESP